MNIAKLLLSLDNQYNSHYQTVIKGLTIQQGLDICKELEEYTENKYCFVLEVWSAGTFLLYQKDGLGDGKDRLILSTDG